MLPPGPQLLLQAQKHMPVAHTRSQYTQHSDSKQKHNGLKKTNKLSSHWIFSKPLFYCIYLSAQKWKVKKKKHHKKLKKVTAAPRPNPRSQSEKQKDARLHSDCTYWGRRDTDEVEEGGGGGGSVGGRPTPGGRTGGEEVIADWWLGASIPLVAISGGPEGDTSPKLMSQVY